MAIAVAMVAQAQSSWAHPKSAGVCCHSLPPQSPLPRRVVRRRLALAVPRLGTLLVLPGIWISSTTVLNSGVLDYWLSYW